ncbi:peptidyl-prolyl cis-trans isomerase [Betaproteobacteria bacterium PRO7]|jgi:peptidyl-prolyl cis-trans isomerase A (cyclophilin A)|nr:peptidyl-prolyl cis-trans isomerase [Burkholderiaceae bacterium]MDL1862596.1 peptidyl-prolyl cis-trans isomerase [Betaproteobacteria bacterium PRO7]
MNPLTRILALAFGPLLAVAGVDAGAQPAAPRVVLSTSEGDITVELNAAKAPKTVENFLAYVKSGHYDGTIFHRVIDGFMIQGGGFTPDMKQKPTKAPIPLESKNGLKNERGTIAMARTSVPDSATSQFFINVVDNPRLDYPNPDGNGYAVFGKVVAGMEVVDKIRVVPTTSAGGHQNVPTKPVLIRAARIAQ